MNTNFNGKLVLKNPSRWTDGMLEAINNNKTIQKKLSDSNIIGYITSKIERYNTLYPARHFKGDTIYKAHFIVKDDNLTFFEKIRRILCGGKLGDRYTINNNFHSEQTTIMRINNLKM